MYRYQGDVSLRHGGYYFSVGKEETKYGYSSVVRVTPCSDAGGPDNLFWVETLLVNIPSVEDRAKNKMLDYVDMSEEKLKAMTPAQRFAELVYACMAYGCYSREDTGRPSNQTVQIGPKDEFYSGHEEIPVDVQLRAGSSLRNWLKKTHLKRSHK